MTQRCHIKIKKLGSTDRTKKEDFEVHSLPRPRQDVVKFMKQEESVIDDET